MTPSFFVLLVLVCVPCSCYTVKEFFTSETCDPGTSVGGFYYQPDVCTTYCECEWNCSTALPALGRLYEHHEFSKYDECGYAMPLCGKVGSNKHISSTQQKYWACAGCPTNCTGNPPPSPQAVTKQCKVFNGWCGLKAYRIVDNFVDLKGQQAFACESTGNSTECSGLKKISDGATVTADLGTFMMSETVLHARGLFRGKQNGNQTFAIGTMVTVKMTGNFSSMIYYVTISEKKSVAYPVQPATSAPPETVDADRRFNANPMFGTYAWQIASKLEGGTASIGFLISSIPGAQVMWKNFAVVDSTFADELNVTDIDTSQLFMEFVDLKVDGVFGGGSGGCSLFYGFARLWGLVLLVLLM